MIIEPVGGERRGRTGRARALAALAAPLVLLVAVVATGALARDDATADADVTTRAVAAGTSTAPTPVSAPRGEAGEQGAATRTSAATIPIRALGLTVRTVDATLGARRSGMIGDALVAVRGFVTVGPNLDACLEAEEQPGAAVPASMCERSAILRDGSVPAFSVAAGQLHWDIPAAEPYLHLTAFPGLSLGALDPVPGQAADEPAAPAGSDWLTPTPVIVIGRFDDPRVADPRSNARHPNDRFVVERLVWADGRWQDRRFYRTLSWIPDDLDLRTARAIVAEALPGGTVILSQTVVGPATLARLDSDASAAVRSLVADDDRLWYVRVMTRTAMPGGSLADETSPRRLGWVVLSNQGEVLASDRDA